MKHLDDNLKEISQINFSQRERLAYIEFRLLFLGNVRRQDLIEQFGIASAAATRDFKLYRELSPNNLKLDGSSKVYILSDSFSPIFDHDPERVLSTLSRGFGNGGGQACDAFLPCELPLLFNRPSIGVLAPISRAISQKRAVKVNYFSNRSGLSDREIVPFALANDGLRWHVRAFDRKSGEFRDFVLTRIEAIYSLETELPEAHELAERDHQWNRIVELEIVPHPDREFPKVIERDYGMVAGVLRLEVRAAMAGYILRFWQVDCSDNHFIVDKGCRLWLRDPLVLYGVGSAVLALGYNLK
ncbi:WYL domain-containing protein [Leucothrix sargassi]|nr:WYL domain-containing protein [Leucothrix sargassi]